MSGSQDNDSSSRAPTPSKPNTSVPAITFTTVTIHKTDLWNLLKAELVQRTVSWFALRIFSAAPLAFYFAWRQQRRRRRQIRSRKQAPQGIAGSTSAVETLRTHVVTALRNQRALKKLKIPPVRGITLSGPSGCGKLELIRMLCRESGAYFICMHARELQSVEDVEAAFQDAVSNAAYGRGVVLGLARVDQLTEYGAHVVGTMMDELATMDRSSRIKVLATCGKMRDMDPQLRRVGRFELEVQLNDPTPDDRQEIFKLHTSQMQLDSSVDLLWLAEKTPGYSGSDIALLCSLAQQNALKKKIQEVSKDDDIIDVKDVNNVSVTIDADDFKKALQEVDQPTSLREFKIEVPEVKWEDIGGLKDVKREVRDLVQIPVQHPEVFKKLNINPPKGLLLYGPPGCGKTMVARAIAKQCSSNFISVKGPELVSMWYGESAKGVERVFDRARQSAPCVLFFDEFDSIAQPRGQALYSSGASTENDRIVAQLLNEMDGLSQDKLVFVVAATNSPNGVDTALLRPGRFDEIIYVPLPKADSRKQIFVNALKNTQLDNNIDIDDLVRRTEGYSGADVTYVCKRALKLAFREVVSGVVDQQQKDNRISPLNQNAREQDEQQKQSNTFDAQINKFSQKNNNCVNLQFGYDSGEEEYVKIFLNCKQQQKMNSDSNRNREIDLEECIQEASPIEEEQKLKRHQHLMNGLIAAATFCILPLPGKKFVPLMRFGLMAPMFLIMALDQEYQKKQINHRQKREQQRIFVEQSADLHRGRNEQQDSIAQYLTPRSCSTSIQEIQTSDITQSNNSLLQISSLSQKAGREGEIADNLRIRKKHIEAALADSRRSVSEQQAKTYDKLADQLKRQGAFNEGSDPPDGIYT